MFRITYLYFICASFRREACLILKKSVSYSEEKCVLFRREERQTLALLQWLSAHIAESQRHFSVAIAIL